MRRRSLWLALVAVVGCHHPPVACGPFPGTDFWTILLTAPDGNRLEGRIRMVGAAPRFAGRAVSPDGAAEPLDYPLDSLTTRGDSVRFRFSPSHILVEGACVDRDRVEARYEEDLRSGSDHVTGHGALRRDVAPR